MRQSGAGSTLVVVRGNSGSGKSAVAGALRRRLGPGAAAIVDQDHLRRGILGERDERGGLAPELIAHTAAFCLARMPVVIVEGILAASRYREALRGMVESCPGRSLVYYLDVDLAGTLARHATRPQAAEFTAEEMAGWYLPEDVLGLEGEFRVPQSWSLTETVDRICADLGGQWRPVRCDS
ncbi:AAA family ATPase [Actinocorallia longicatena]|uniref:Kinase n=1 Tax=Actinocorallia longicatena TaxID=111803 RepID=A0ABP6QL46_9ACTN